MNRSLSSLSLLLAGATLASAQAPANPPPASAPVHLDEFVVTASPYARAQHEIAAPTSVLAGARLAQALQPTLGETLAGQPGVASTAFGPGASRPVIRGLGGDRIRVLQRGVGTLDASVISPDHAVTLEPLLVERIEVVRGPATLLYGGSAIGGVVNVIDDRIPGQPPAAAYSGRVEARVGSAADARAAAGVVRGKAGAFAFHLDGFARETDDLRIPGYAETEALREEHHDHDEDEPPARGRLPDSATRTSGAGLGVSYLSDRGHLGFSYSGLGSVYGVPGHEHGHHDDDHHDHEELREPLRAAGDDHEDEAVSIDLDQRRWDLHGELREPAQGFRAARLQFGSADYLHRELEGDEVGTTFTNRAVEGRLELLHEPVGGFEGALGFQYGRSDFAAAGEEAFLPPTLTRQHALFLFEETTRGAATWQLGARVEDQKVSPEPGTGLAATAHTSASFSGGVVWKLGAGWSVAASASRSERAPNAQELFADGPHAATRSYEIGDPGLGTERALGLDLSLRRRTGPVTGALTVFTTDFADYIYEQATGREEDGLDEYEYVQRDARFRGAEIELTVHLHETTGQLADLRFMADTVRADNRDSGRPLPRITPTRVGTGLDLQRGALGLSVDVLHGFEQDRTAPGETASPAYTTVGASVVWRLRVFGSPAELFVRGTNLTDETVRPHTSFLKDLAPLAGRDFTAGVRLTF
jgi:iron complex outermembrane recepter protein